MATHTHHTDHGPRLELDLTRLRMRDYGGLAARTADVV